MTSDTSPNAAFNTPARYFEDIALGETYRIPSRTQTDALFASFQLTSADNSPVHYDMEFCKAQGWPGLLAHGFQVLAQTCPGASDIHRSRGRISLRGIIEQSSKFLKPVYSGDTLYPRLEVVELTPQRTTGVMTLRSTVHNQRDELVMDGRIKLLLNRRPRESA
jgi:acyl dehydratase